MTTSTVAHTVGSTRVRIRPDTYLRSARPRQAPRAAIARKWIDQGLLRRVGTRSFAFAGSELTWLSEVAAGLADLDGAGVLAGRAASRCLGLDGFEESPVELIVPRNLRGRNTSARLVSTRAPFLSGDLVTIHGFRVTSALRTVLDAPLFRFSKEETENAIDSAIRLRVLSEQRLRTQAIARHRAGVNGSRLLLEALIDTGGESRLERRFLSLLRTAGIDRPITQKIFHESGRFVARVDAFFPGDLVVELAGHGTHATRLQRAADAQRHTELTLLGQRVLTFTYEHVTGRPLWVATQILQALAQVAG